MMKMRMKRKMKKKMMMKRSRKSKEEIQFDETCSSNKEAPCIVTDIKNKKT